MLAQRGGVISSSLSLAHVVKVKLGTIKLLRKSDVTCLRLCVHSNTAT